ncbi:MAG: asparaginase [Burkholderiaceae bacterium]|nr:MAG: asparaginase [Burkholderiaceae bacterium]
MKRLILLGTGGTIAGASAHAADVDGYTPAALTVEQLLASVPHGQALQPIETEQLFQIGSEDMTPAHWCTLAQRTQALLERDDVAAVVITHGTDTLEETAWFLQLVLRSAKPVVLVGAMRPATAPDADGPRNLADALLLVRSPEAQYRGVLVVMGGTIFSAHDVTKRFAGRIDAFTAGAAQPLGRIENHHLEFFALAPLHLEEPLPLADTLPAVEIVYGYASDSRVAVDALVQAGVQGIVYAAPGSGTLSVTMRAALCDAVARGVSVVRASRTGAGRVRAHTHEADDARLFISANSLNPQKARILLMLALAAERDRGNAPRGQEVAYPTHLTTHLTMDVTRIQQLFDRLG